MSLSRGEFYFVSMKRARRGTLTLPYPRSLELCKVVNWDSGCIYGLVGDQKRCRVTLRMTKKERDAFEPKLDELGFMLTGPIAA
jgi:hypothetical protein